MARSWIESQVRGIGCQRVDGGVSSFSIPAQPEQSRTYPIRNSAGSRIQDGGVARVIQRGFKLSIGLIPAAPIP